MEEVSGRGMSPENINFDSVPYIKTEVMKDYDPEVYKKAEEVLRAGGLVAFPTETVYGLGGDGLNPSASMKIYAAKGRPSDNPLIVHIGKIEQLRDLVAEVPESAKKLMDRFWPGPLTIIFKKSPQVPYETTGGLETVAIRMPSHPVANKLLSESLVPVAAPSANLSGRPSPTSPHHVIEDLSGRIDLIIDGGDVEIGLESTIVDVTGECPMILRPGFITEEMLEDLLGEIKIDPAILKKPQKDFHPKAPGMKYKHYAPKADLTLFSGDKDEVVSHINALVKEAEAMGKKVGILATKETEGLYQSGEVLSLGEREDEKSISHNLYRMLRRCDEDGLDVVYGEVFYQHDLGLAIMNRLSKAAGYQIIDLKMPE